MVKSVPNDSSSKDNPFAASKALASAQCEQPGLLNTVISICFFLWSILVQLENIQDGK